MFLCLAICYLTSRLRRARGHALIDLFFIVPKCKRHWRDGVCIYTLKPYPNPGQDLAAAPVRSAVRIEVRPRIAA